jgi:hypothetical protein
LGKSGTYVQYSSEKRLIEGQVTLAFPGFGIIPKAIENFFFLILVFEEFLFAYQKPIFERSGAVCYGCCENLTHKSGCSPQTSNSDGTPRPSP